MRRAAIGASVAAALGRPLKLAFVPTFASILIRETFARRTTLVVARLAGRDVLRRGGSHNRWRIGTRPLKISMALTSPAAMALAFDTLACLGLGDRRLSRGR